MMRFRAGKLRGSAGVPGGYSLMTVPTAAMRSIKPAFDPG